MDSRPPLAAKIYGVVFLLLGALCFLQGFQTVFFFNESNAALSQSFDGAFNASLTAIESNMPRALAQLKTPAQRRQYRALIGQFKAGWPAFRAAYLREFRRNKALVVLVYFLSSLVLLSAAIPVLFRREIRYNRVYGALALLAVIYVMTQYALWASGRAVAYSCGFAYKTNVLFNMPTGIFSRCASGRAQLALLFTRIRVIRHLAVFLILFSSFMYFRRLREEE